MTTRRAISKWRGYVQPLDAFLEMYPQWTREEALQHPVMRFAEAYLMMADLKYRPAAPNDGMGNIMLSSQELQEQYRLHREAVDYAVRFVREEESHAFNIGCSNYTTNRAFALVIEAARLLSSGDDGNPFAISLLESAIDEIKFQHARQLSKRRKRKAA